MSEITVKSKSFFDGIKFSDCIATGAAGGCIYLWGEINSMNTSLNNRIIEITEILKRMNRNSRILDMQLTSHLHHHQMKEKDSDLEDNNSTSTNQIDLEFKEEIFARLKYLEDRVAHFESVNNPMITKIEKAKVKPSPFVTSNDNSNNMFLNKNISNNVVHFGVNKEYRGDQTQPIL